MSVRCPHCGNLMELKGQRPGRFTPRCPQCARKFILVVPEGDRPLRAMMPDADLQPAASASNAAVGTVAPSALQTAATTLIQPVYVTLRPAPWADEAADSPAGAICRRLGGYAILQKLGEGGMGSVYLARQLSLDRNVAVKVLRPGLSQDPAFIARFAREAYAAAQLSHHNIVQIHDIGQDEIAHFFSMEFVEGQSLAALLNESGRLEAETAVALVLQAARGLKFAHDRAMIHRDVRPENLLLNEQGLVKVADLGLVMQRGSTPDYRAPEQACDAAAADARADVYSLGCTLYTLLTGRPPFLGNSAAEVITKHAREPITPPGALVRGLPTSLSAIVMKMMAKKPENRYANMDQVIVALEDFLGVAGEGKPFTPNQEHARALEFTVEQFNRSAWARLRRAMIASYFALCAGATLLLLFLARGGDAVFYSKFAGGIVGLAVLSFASYVVLSGVTQKTYLFRKLRQYVFGASIVDWCKSLLALAVLIGLLVMFDLHWVWLGFLIAAAVLAALFHFTIDAVVRHDRRSALEQVERLLKALRLRGLDEEALRCFVCKFSGLRWEEFYETLFGYEAKMRARHRWAVRGGGRDGKKWGAWRDPVIAWVDRRMHQRQEQRQQRYLVQLEEQHLRAQGVEECEARTQALQTVNAAVAQAHTLRQPRPQPSVPDTPTPPIDPISAPAGPDAIVDVSAAASLGEEQRRNRQTDCQRKDGSIWGLCMLAAALLIFSGNSLHLPTLKLVQPEHAGLMAGSGVAVLGLVFGRQ